MADVTFTAASVLAGTGAIKVKGYAGETITADLVVYQKAADSEYYIAHCTTSAATAVAVGIALNGAGNAQPLEVQTEGNLTCDNLTLVAATGCVYVLSASGKICPAADLAADDYVTIIGVATSTTNLKLGITVSGVVGTA